MVETEEGIKRKIEIKLDLTFENSDLLGCNTFHMGYKSTEFIQKMLVEYPSLYTVTMIFKEFLDKRGLLNAYQGKAKVYKIALKWIILLIISYKRSWKFELFIESSIHIINLYLLISNEFSMYIGGISSYCLILMILATFVKFGDNGYDLATRRFLKFYGEEFYPEKTGITLMQQE